LAYRLRLLEAGFAFSLWKLGSEALLATIFEYLLLIAPRRFVGALGLKNAAVLIVVVLGLLANKTSAQTQNDIESGSFLCIEEMSTGFSIDETGRGWKQTRFNTTKKFLVRPAKEAEIFNKVAPGLIPYVVVTFGQEDASYRCGGGFGYNFGGEITPIPQAYCNGFLGEFLVNRQTLRFLYTYTGGYIDSKQGAEQIPGNTPFITLGTCSRL